MSVSDKFFCYFTLERKQYLGELVLSGENTSLLLHSRQPIPYTSEPHSIFGESVDYQKISLFDCVGDRSLPEGMHPNVVYKRATFPHYAVIGQRHIEQHEPLFGSVSFSTDDLGLIFASRGTFGSVHPDHEDLQALLDKAYGAGHVTVTNNPLIFYFSGTKDEADADIFSGLFSVFQGFGTEISDHAGIQCSSQTTATLKFHVAKTLDEVIDELVAISLFLTTIAGRYQGISRVTADIFDPKSEPQPETPEKVAVHWSYAPTVGKQSASNVWDVPMTPQVDNDGFYKVFHQWRQKHQEWLPSRLRIINSQKVGRDYDENRLVAAANAFDILPESTYPEAGELSKPASEAREKCKAIMRALDSGEERTQIMNTLTFWSGKNLTLKVLSRSRMVHEVLGASLPDIDEVLKVAIKARNYFVHGTDKFGWKHYSELLSFFTDALEFVFVASDLIECGWDAKSWAARRPGYSHPLGAFMKSYSKWLAEFKLAVESAKE